MSSGTGKIIKTAGVIGLGVGLHHADAYRAAGLDVLVHDFDPLSSMPLYAESVESWRDLINWSDVVSVCSWDQYHEEQIIYALENGKHVLCEKPLVLTREAYDRVMAIAEKGEVLLDCSLPLRYVFGSLNPSTTAATYSYVWGRNHKLHDSWRSRTPGYNVTLGGLIHMIDLMHRDFGAVEKIIINHCANLNSPQVAYDFIDVECVMASGKLVWLHGDFSKDDGVHYSDISQIGKNFYLSSRCVRADKGAPVRAFLEKINTGPVLDWGEAHVTAFEIHEKALAYLKEHGSADH